MAYGVLLAHDVKG